MPWKEVRTAGPDQSIWFHLSEDSFRRHLVALEERTNAVPIDPQVFPVPAAATTTGERLSVTCSSDKDGSGTSYTLPLEAEQQLADDFACLSAVEEGAQSVAAVCVEEHTHQSGLTLRFAALDTSLGDAVKEALRSVSDILAEAASDQTLSCSSARKTASSYKSSDDHLLSGTNVTGDPSDTFSAAWEDGSLFSSRVNALLVPVLELHHRRLLARLRSAKWDKPTHLAKSHKKPLCQDFANLIHRVQFLYTKRERTARRHVERMLHSLAEMYQSFESLPAAASSEIERQSLHQAVSGSFGFCIADESREFARRLQQSAGAAPTKQIASAMKCLRQIEKIAAYRRICISLVRTARLHPALFRKGIAMEFLPPYKSVPTSIGYEEWARTCHVHAEVQLAVHYDLVAASSSSLSLQSGKPTFLPPRTIGISKWLCYLCCKFLQAHGGFFPSKTHGRLYDQWTIPDLAEFDVDQQEEEEEEEEAEQQSYRRRRRCRLLERYRDIVKFIDAEVLRQTENEPELWRVEPMTSRQDLLLLGSSFSVQSRLS